MKITLLQNLPDCKAGHTTDLDIQKRGAYFDGYYYTIKYMTEHPDFFRIEQEDESLEKKIYDLPVYGQIAYADAKDIALLAKEFTLKVFDEVIKGNKPHGSIPITYIRRMIETANWTSREE